MSCCLRNRGIKHDSQSDEGDLVNDNADSGNYDEQNLISIPVIASNDLLIEILLRLPVNSILRFKSVSKRWFNLISSPHFLRKLYRHNNGVILQTYESPCNPTHTVVSFNGYSENATAISLDFSKDGRDIHILDSYNGLLCCCSINKKMEDDFNSYYIYNPSTEQYYTLPDPKCKFVYSITLASNPLKPQHYKAVCIIPSNSNHKQENYEISVFSSESRKWSDCKGFFFDAHLCFSRGFFYNGIVHWISSKDTSICFDVDQELLHIMPMPPVLEEDSYFSFAWSFYKYMYFGASNGHLHMIKMKANLATSFDVFEMEQDYSSWFVKYSVDLETFMAAYTKMPGPYVVSILSFIEAEEEVDRSELVIRVHNKVISYNLKDNSFKKVCDKSPGAVEWYTVFPYTQTPSRV